MSEINRDKLESSDNGKQPSALNDVIDWAEKESNRVFKNPEQPKIIVCFPGSGGANGKIDEFLKIPPSPQLIDKNPQPGGMAPALQKQIESFSKKELLNHAEQSLSQKLIELLKNESALPPAETLVKPLLPHEPKNTWLDSLPVERAPRPRQPVHDPRPRDEIVKPVSGSPEPINGGHPRASIDDLLKPPVDESLPIPRAHPPGASIDDLLKSPIDESLPTPRPHPLDDKHNGIYSNQGGSTPPGAYAEMTGSPPTASAPVESFTQSSGSNAGSGSGSFSGRPFELSKSRLEIAPPASGQTSRPPVPSLPSPTSAGGRSPRERQGGNPGGSHPKSSAPPPSAPSSH